MELNTDTKSGSFVIQIRQLSLHGWQELKMLGFGLSQLYWGPEGFNVTFAQLVLAPDMSIELPPAGIHTPEEGRRFVVRRLSDIAEILRKIELGGVPSRFDWTRNQLGSIPSNLNARDQFRSRA